MVKNLKKLFLGAVLVKKSKKMLLMIATASAKKIGPMFVTADYLPN